MKTLVLFLTVLVVGVLSKSVRNDEVMEVKSKTLSEVRVTSLLEALEQKAREQGADSVIAGEGSGNEWGASGDRALKRSTLKALRRIKRAAHTRKAGAEVPGAVVPGEITHGSWGTQRKMARVSMPDKK